MKLKKILIIFGTRPEIIKTFSVYHELKQKKYDVKLCNTGQHKDMIRPFLKTFSLKPDFNLHTMKKNQSLAELTKSLLSELDSMLDRWRPDMVLVQGDTTSAMAGALTAFYKKILIGHIEAGLRTYNKNSPFPEEMNRVFISRLADLHFAPTKRAVTNLLQEGIDKSKIFLTGNTVVDAVKWCDKKQLRSAVDDKNNKHIKNILVTCHRRENFDGGMKEIFKSLVHILHTHQDVHIIFPVHLNPNVQVQVKSYLIKKITNHNDIKRLHLLPPIEYIEMLTLIKKSYLILTDSGGIQEEAPYFGKPVIVLREQSERMEAVEAGSAVIAGHNHNLIISFVDKLITGSATYTKMARIKNPFGNGNAAKYIERALRDYNKI